MPMIQSYILLQKITMNSNKNSDDFNGVASWLESNDLIMNMKAGKTECMIFGTSQKIKNKELNIAYHHQSISKASTYKYLGLTLDQTLNLNDHLTKSYKKATGRLNLLRRLRYQLTEKAATTIYQSMLIPLFTYCSIVTCRTSMTYKHKVNSLENRAHEILFRSKPSNKRLPSIEHLMNKKLCLKCINGDSCDNFNDYFEIMNNKTRNNGILIRLPKIRLESSKKSFFYYGAKCFNDLPAQDRGAPNSQEFLNYFENI